MLQTPESAIMLTIPVHRVLHTKRRTHLRVNEGLASPSRKVAFQSPRFQCVLVWVANHVGLPRYARQLSLPVQNVVFVRQEVRIPS